MKKILTSLLALCLTLSLMTLPVASAATPTTVAVNPLNYDQTKITWYSDSACTTPAKVDLTEYTTNWNRRSIDGVLKYKPGNASYANGTISNHGVLSIDAYALETPVLEINVPEITADGWYNVSYYAGGYYEYSKVSPFEISLTKKSDANYSKTIAYHYPGVNSGTNSTCVGKVGYNDGVWLFDGGKVELEAGSDYVMHIKLGKAYILGQNQYDLMLSDIVLTPMATTLISTTKATVLEYEDYATYYKGVKDGASNNYLIREKTAYMSSKTTPYVVTMPVTIAKEGYYDWKAIMSTKAGNTYVSKMTLAIDGETIGDNTLAGLDTDIQTWKDECTFDMDEYTGTVHLTKGEHIVTTTIDCRYTDKSSSNSMIGFAADSFSLECQDKDIDTSIPIEISGETTIEMENYASLNSCSESTQLSGASNNKILTCSSTANSSYITYSIPINVTTAGYYDTEFMTSSTADSIFSRSGLSFSIDDIFIGDNVQQVESYTTRMTPDLTGGTYNMYKIKASTIYLDKGNHTISMKAQVPLNGSATSSLKFSADYFKLTPATNVKIPINSKKTFELEEYNKQLSAANQYASNGSLLYHEWHYTMGKSYDIITLPIQITHKGFYQFKLPMTSYSSKKSKLNLTLDGENILTNSGIGNISDLSPNPSPNWKISMFETTKLLEPGTYILKLNATADHNLDTHFKCLQKFGADYISIEMVDPGDFLQQDDESLLINKSIGKDVTGTAYAAFYLGGQLVDVQTKTVSNENSVLFDIQNKTWKDYDRASVYVWDANKQTPLCEQYSYTFMPLNKTPFNDNEEEINIVFIGDSLYEAYGVTESHKFSTQVGEWFKEQYEDEDTKVNYYNKGAGGTTSEYSLVRVVRDVINLNPDVVFFGTTINDGSRNTTRNMESVIRTLQALENPPYIIMTRFPTSTFSGVPAYGKALADHYGIPFIDTTEYFEDAVEEGAVMKNLFMDGVHPNDDGNDIQSTALIDRIETSRYFHKGSNDTEKLLQTSGEIDPASADYFSILDSRVERSSGWTVNSNNVQTSTAGETLKFKFTGNILAFNYGLHNDAAQMEVYVDGSLVFTCDPYYPGATNFQKVCKETSAHFDLPDGEHEVEMKVIKSANSSVIATTQYMRIYDIFTASWAD